MIDSYSSVKQDCPSERKVLGTLLATHGRQGTELTKVSRFSLYTSLKMGGLRDWRTALWKRDLSILVDDKLDLRQQCIL